ncbi:MAG: deoxyribonuclease IV [Saccharofermentanales bacterium]
MLYLGCHLSSSAGYLAMARTASSIQANTFQFFSRNPRGTRARALDPDDLAAFNVYAQEQGLGRIVAHAPYTLNLASAKPQLRTLSRQILREDLLRLRSIDRAVYNLHPGSHTGQGLAAGAALIIEGLNEVLTEEIRTPVLLETMSGKGSEIGGSFEELARILEGVRLNDRMGVCMDSCHMHDAGYDLDEGLEKLLENFDRLIGLDRLQAFHLNDSLNSRGSRRDRHAPMGQGHLGLAALLRIMKHPKLRHLPFILETPHDTGGHAQEIRMLRSLLDDGVQEPISSLI